MPRILNYSMVTPVFEVTYMGPHPPFFVTPSMDRLGGLRSYRQPQLQNNRSERYYACRHREMSEVYFSSTGYKLSTVTDDPIDMPVIHDQVILRYQLNPHKRPCVQPPRDDDAFVFETFFLREVFVETAPQEGTCWSADAMHGACDIDVYTRSEGIFAPSDAVMYDDGDAIGAKSGEVNRCRKDEEECVLIYSTNPSKRAVLERPLSAMKSSPALVVDEVFFSWDTLGWMSLNELHDMCSLQCEYTRRKLFDFAL